MNTEKHFVVTIKTPRSDFLKQVKINNTHEPEV
jgi:hypothetical protein